MGPGVKKREREENNLLSLDNAVMLYNLGQVPENQRKFSD